MNSLFNLTFLSILILSTCVRMLDPIQQNMMYNDQNGAQLNSVGLTQQDRGDIQTGMKLLKGELTQQQRKFVQNLQSGEMDINENEKMKVIKFNKNQSKDCPGKKSEYIIIRKDYGNCTECEKEQKGQIKVQQQEVVPPLPVIPKPNITNEIIIDAPIINTEYIYQPEQHKSQVVVPEYIPQQPQQQVVQQPQQQVVQQPQQVQQVQQVQQPVQQVQQKKQEIVIIPPQKPTIEEQIIIDGPIINTEYIIEKPEIQPVVPQPVQQVQQIETGEIVEDKCGEFKICQSTLDKEKLDIKEKMSSKLDELEMTPELKEKVLEKLTETINESSFYNML